MSETLGQAEQERAFQEWLDTKVKPNKGWLTMPGNAIARGRHLGMMLRLAYGAGEKRGLELRGCCEHQEPPDA